MAKVNISTYYFASPYFSTKNGQIQVSRKIFYITNAVFFTLSITILTTGAMAIFTEEDYLIVFGMGAVAGFISSIFWGFGYEKLKKKTKRDSIHFSDKRRAGTI